MLSAARWLPRPDSKRILAKEKMRPEKEFWPYRIGSRPAPYRATKPKSGKHSCVHPGITLCNPKVPASNSMPLKAQKQPNYSRKIGKNSNLVVAVTGEID